MAEKKTHIADEANKTWKPIISVLTRFPGSLLIFYVELAHYRKSNTDNMLDLRQYSIIYNSIPSKNH